MNITLPGWYDDLSEFECKSKGCALNFEVVFNGVNMLFDFYDIVRLSQDAKEEINENGYFRDANAVVLLEVTKENIMKYLNSLI